MEKLIKEAEKIVSNETRKLAGLPDQQSLSKSRSTMKEDKMVDLTFDNEEKVTQIYEDLKDYQELHDRLSFINDSNIKSLQ